jgi:hypothetical protein
MSRRGVGTPEEYAEDFEKAMEKLSEILKEYDKRKEKPWTHSSGWFSRTSVKGPNNVHLEREILDDLKKCTENADKRLNEVRLAFQKLKESFAEEIPANVNNTRKKIMVKTKTDALDDFVTQVGALLNSLERLTNPSHDPGNHCDPFDRIKKKGLRGRFKPSAFRTMILKADADIWKPFSISTKRLASAAQSDEHFKVLSARAFLEYRDKEERQRSFYRLLIKYEDIVGRPVAGYTSYKAGGGGGRRRTRRRGASRRSKTLRGRWRH